MAAITRTLSTLADYMILVLGALCLIAAAIAQGGRFSRPLDVPAHFAPFWLLGAIMVATYGLIFASPTLRLAITGVGAVGAVAAGLLILPEYARPIRPTVSGGGQYQIKVIQFNVWDRNADVEATADWVDGQRPDFVLMEEVQAPIRQALVARGYGYIRGKEHTAIFTHATPLPSPFRVPEADWPVLPGFARATFAGPNGPFSIFAVHLTWPTNPSQAADAQVLARLLDRYDGQRLIVGGDFNLTPWSFALRNLDKRFQLERRDRAIFSWPARPFLGGWLPSPVPLLPIDHIYAGSDWRTVKIERGPGLGSDHYPLVATLVLTK
jgi:endonuclease/exonuclease/phosphatase (EEP) superfamily protein YafD